jgi:3-oxoacyl-[acyl-carrier-protein] synthase II
MTLSKRRVVVTGLGIVSPVGNNLKEAWANIVAGRSGVRLITEFDASDLPVKISGSVRDFDAEAYIPKKDLKKMDTFIHFGVAAGLQAMEDAGLEVTDQNAERIGVAIGSGIGGLPTIERSRDAYVSGGFRKISPFFVPASIINMVSGNLSIIKGLKGPNISIVSACTTGAHNIGDAARMIMYGDADVMIAGGTEMCTTPLGVGGFAAARALSTRNEEPERASRPWDLDRDGFVLGDGAGVVVLEEYEFAKRRGARIYCELAGYGMSSDAHHMTQPAPGGEGAARCMANALVDGGINLEEVSYINAHGTSTPAGDVAETEAVKRCLGDYAYKVPVSSTKSMTGHLLGAAGGIEAVFCVMAINDQVLPPTINLDKPDPACDLDYVPNEAREAKVEVVLSNSFGFGGTNGTLAFRKL